MYKMISPETPISSTIPRQQSSNSVTAQEGKILLQVLKQCHLDQKNSAAII